MALAPKLRIVENDCQIHEETGMEILLDCFPMALTAVDVFALLPMTVICDDARTVVRERQPSQAMAFLQHHSVSYRLQESIEP